LVAAPAAGLEPVPAIAEPVPRDFNDGNWLATGVGVSALADTLEIMPAGSLPQPLVEKIRALLGKEIVSIADDWHTKRSWFIRGNVPQTNSGYCPSKDWFERASCSARTTFGRIRVGCAEFSGRMDAQGSRGEFCEGIGYASFSVESMIRAARAMAAAGDMRGLSHPYLHRFPTWMAHHLQPGRFRINCFDSGGAKTTVTDWYERACCRRLSCFTTTPWPGGRSPISFRPLGRFNGVARPHDRRQSRRAETFCPL